MALDFRAEAFNVFNHTQFRIYDPVLGNQANNTVSCYGSEGSADAYSAGDPGNGGTDSGCLGREARFCIRWMREGREPFSSV